MMAAERAPSGAIFTLPWPSEPMLAKPTDQLPLVKALPGGCLYEPKWDGYRGLLGVGTSGIGRLRSRRGTNLADAFPDVVSAAIGQLPAGTLVDGELVVWNGQHLDFTQLQRRMASPANARRLAKTQPASYVIFDVLALDGRTLDHEPLRVRRRALEQLLPSLAPPLQITPATRDRAVAGQWLADYAAAEVGIEGLVIKGLAEPYRPGRRDWLKLRSRDTVEAIVGAVTGSRTRPERLILAIPRHDRGLIIAGSTGPLKPAQQKQVSVLLQPAGQDHPWPSRLPAGRTGAWRAEPLDVVLVDPVLVVEVAADTAYEYGRWRHLTRFIRARPDLNPGDVESIR